MSNPTKVSILLLVVLLLAACSATGDGGILDTPPQDKSELDKVNQAGTATDPVGKTPEVGQSAGFETETATFALG